MKTMQPVLEPPKDRYEEWIRFLNRMETQLRTLSYYKKIKIKVRYDG